MIVTRLEHLMFIIFMSHHACTVLLYMIYHPNYSYIVITVNSRYCQTYCSSYFNALLVLLLHFHVLTCTLVGPLLTDYYYFSVSRSESQYRELIVNRILVQSFSGEFSFFLTYLIQIWWMILFMI